LELPARVSRSSGCFEIDLAGQAAKLYWIEQPCRKTTGGQIPPLQELQSTLMMKDQRSDLLCNWAIEAGFDRAAVAVLKPAANRDFFLDWLARGMHAGMGYLARRAEARLNPAMLFPQASSALCVALQYHGDEPADAESGDLWPGVARYARGRDYHDLMGERLEVVAQRIEQEIPGTSTRWYVDTGPVLERDLAASCGLGAIGKNTCLLHPDAGSWFLIGEIFTSLQLTPSHAPIADMCGSCRHCLEACPTGALPRAYELDANRCISYWTIEHRGDVPADIRPLLGGWVFGCDICQEVCPHNEGPLPAADDAFLLPDERRGLTLEGLLALGTDRYRELFSGSPLKRAKLEGLKRNAVIAMGNSGSSGYLDSLLEVLVDGSASLRSHAAWALGQIGGPRASKALERAAEREADPTVGSEISSALATVAGLS
jgi:epoxyqueuosine reductase